MNIMAISMNKVSIKPTRRKVIRAVYATEIFTRNIQKDLPKEARGFAQNISERCNKLRTKMTNN